MKYLLFIFFVIVSNVSVCSAQENNIRIGWIKEGLSAKEANAIEKFLREEELDYLVCSPNELTNDFLQRNHITNIWWEKNIPKKATSEEIRLGKVIKNFVSSGGHLVLSMDAVLLLNDWGIEKNKFDIRIDSVRDEGFGRPCGFHAFLSNPIFNGLNGGSYIWKGKKDNIVRKIGFLDDHLPADTSLAKVVGIGWTYITFHEDEKLLLKYHLGKGDIYAVGAYTYFAKENFNTLQLYRFYKNILQCRGIKSEKRQPNYWSFTKPDVRLGKKHLPTLSIAPATKWDIPPFTLKMQRKEASTNFVDVVGRRVLLMAKEQGGIEEIWMHPFMAFRDIRTGVSLKNSDSVIWLDKLTPLITVSPDMLVRQYIIAQDTLREIITASIDKPLAILHYDWSRNNIHKVWVQYTTNQRLMWPYSDTCNPIMYYQWSDRLNTTLVSSPHAGLASLFGFSNRPQNKLLGQYGQFRIQNGGLVGVPTNLHEVSGIFEFDADRLDGKLNVYMAAGNEGTDQTVALYKNAMPSFNDLYEKSSNYYQRLFNSQLMITSPDTLFNEGYRWAFVRSNQFLQTTPGIGTSLMAGFGTTARGWNGRQKVSGRPGYAWYFGRDGVWSGMALDALGEQNKVRDVLNMFVKYQAVNGKIFHELTSSGAVHYDAADATPLFVILAGNYLKHSGDTAYIHSILPAIRKAMIFCYSTDTDHDGLIENTNVGHGWIEGGPLFGSHTEFYLAGTWAAALDEASWMAGIFHQKNLQIKYRNDSRMVKRIIDKDFWSTQQNHFYNGKMNDGSYMKDETVLTAVPVYLNAISDKRKALLTTIPFSNSRFSTDWGLRIIPDNNPKYNARAYHAGMVWPLFSGYASLAEYKTGRYVAGFTHMMDNLYEFRHWSLGSVEETLDGDVFKPAGVCSQQSWSETMVIQPAIEGMLGFYPDAISKRARMTPCFPWDWNRVKVTNLPIGEMHFNMEMQRSKEKYQYSFSKKTPGSFSLILAPILPPGTVIKEVLVDGQKISFKVTQQAEAVKVILPPLNLGQSLEVEIFYKGGYGILPQVNEPQKDARNIGAKIVKQQYGLNQYSVTIEGIPGKRYEFSFFSLQTPIKVDNGKLIKQNGTLFKGNIVIPFGEDKFGKQTVRFKF